MILIDGPKDAAALWLSHPLNAETPAYGGGPGLELEPLTRISAGDTANTLALRMPNHLGTHVDAPAHFFEGARDVCSYDPDDWVFSHPHLVDVDTPSGGLVGPEDVGSALPHDADLLLVRTGYEETRGTETYWAEGPGLSPELGRWLRKERPSIRAVGMDLISVTSRLRRREGREAHRAFLDPDSPGDPILLLEDMALAASPRDLALVLVSPLRLSGADGAPVTAWGFAR